MARTALTSVLLVEDDPDIQLVAYLALADIGGLKVEVCGTGREALSVAPRFRPDLILLDVMMPDMDGVAALHALRAGPETGKIPVVFMTARAQQHELDRYRELGSLGVITKPFEAATLAEALRGLWERHVS
jgi:two-component system OmpR family response regulator